MYDNRTSKNMQVLFRPSFI